MSKPRTMPTLESLKARCVIRGDCWLWQGYIANNTPQVMAYPGGQRKMMSVRRLIWELRSSKPQPDGHYSNTCGDHRCVSPLHTFWRGEKSHMRQMAKKRVVTPAMIKKLRDYRIRTGQAKITEAMAKKIRESEEVNAVLAKRYGINKSLVSKIKRGVAWRDLSSVWSGL